MNHKLLYACVLAAAVFVAYAAGDEPAVSSSQPDPSNVVQPVASDQPVEPDGSAGQPMATADEPAASFPPAVQNAPANAVQPPGVVQTPAPVQPPATGVVPVQPVMPQAPAMPQGSTGVPPVFVTGGTPVLPPPAAPQPQPPPAQPMPGQPLAPVVTQPVLPPPAVPPPLAVPQPPVLPVQNQAVLPGQGVQPGTAIPAEGAPGQNGPGQAVPGQPLAAANPPEKPRSISLVGVVQASKVKSGVVAVKFYTPDAEYVVIMDQRGLDLGNKLPNATAEVTGVVIPDKDQKLLSVQSFRPLLVGTIDSAISMDGRLMLCRLLTASGNYVVVLDDKGVELGEKMHGRKVTVIGTPINEKSRTRELLIKSWEEYREQPGNMPRAPSPPAMPGQTPVKQ